MELQRFSGTARHIRVRTNLFDLNLDKFTEKIGKLFVIGVEKDKKRLVLVFV